MRVIVCGGRDYTDRDTIQRVLRHLNPAARIVLGGARGADETAERVALELGFSIKRYPAEWDRYGRGAGPIRNQKMLGDGADLVIAFPGGRGTAHMVRIAREAGVPVLAVRP